MHRERRDPSRPQPALLVIFGVLCLVSMVIVIVAAPASDDASLCEDAATATCRVDE